MASILSLTLVQLVVVVLLFIALLNGQRDLSVLALLVLGVIGGTRLWARFSQARLHHRLQIDRRRIFPNELVTLTTSIENAKPLPIWLHVEIPVGNFAQADQAMTHETSLLWFQRAQFQSQLRAPRRGVYQIGPLDLTTGDLFSFFSRHTRATETATLIVYPRLVALKPLTLPRRDFFGVPQTTSPVQDPVYILGTRDYQTGQPAKYIHWKASARQNQLQEKVFESTVQEKILLVLNVDSFAKHDAAEEFERALEIIASMAVRLDRQRHAVGLLADNAAVPIARNDQQMATILEALARLDLKREQNILDRLRQEIADTWGITCVYFSYAVDETFESANNYLQRRHVPSMFCVSERPASDSRKIYALDDLCVEATRR